MAITEEQTTQIKEQLLGQLSNFPEDRRDQIKKQIESMTADQVEEFIKQNQLTHMGDQCVFCAIVGGKMGSVKIAENKENIAILEINPLSKGHALIVPTDHKETIPESAKSLASDVKKRLEDKFSPKEVQIKEGKIMGHAILEVIPIYGTETEKKQATEEELKKVQEQIIEKVLEPRPELKPEEPEKEEEIPKLKARIPN